MTLRELRSGMAPYTFPLLALAFALALAAFHEPERDISPFIRAPGDCTNAGGVWTFDARLPGPRDWQYYCLSPKQRERCLASGGEWAVWGGDFVGCVQKSADGGQACTDSKQCKYGCIVPRDTPVTDSTVGACAPDNVTDGPRLFKRQEGKTTSTIGIRE